MIPSLNATCTLLSTLLASSVLDIGPITSIKQIKADPKQLTAEKINKTVALLGETVVTMKSKGKHVKAFIMGEFKDILEHVGDHVEIIKNHSDDDSYQYLQYFQCAVNVLESYAYKYKRENKLL